MGCLLVAANAVLILSIVKNGDTTVFSTFSGVTVSTRDSIANADPSLQTWTPVIPVSPGDFFETYFLNTDASITVQANRSWFSIEVIE